MYYVRRRDGTKWIPDDFTGFAPYLFQEQGVAFAKASEIGGTVHRHVFGSPYND